MDRNKKLEGAELDCYIRERFKPERQEVTTTDLADFGSRERGMLIDLLVAWRDQGLPEDFEPEEVRPMMNRLSGCVFLTNSDYQTAMLNGDRLESWHNCPECGHEGFAEDCTLRDDGDGCNQCKADD